MAHDLAQQILKPAAAAAASADPAAKQFSEEGIKPAANIVAENVQPVAKGFTDQTLLPTAHKVGICYMPSEGIGHVEADSELSCSDAYLHVLDDDFVLKVS